MHIWFPKRTEEFEGDEEAKKKMLVRPGDFDGRCGLEVGSGSALGTIEGGGEEAARHEGGAEGGVGGGPPPPTWPSFREGT